MRLVQLREHERLCAADASRAKQRKVGAQHVLDRKAFDMLRALDLAHATQHTPPSKHPAHYTVLQWDEDTARAQSWVGIMRAGGVQLEILPKIDDASGQEADDAHARTNLLKMLDYAGVLPERPRGAASLDTMPGAWHERLIARFAQALGHELTRGLDRAYTTRREHLPRVQGKLDLPEQLRRYPGRLDRLVCLPDRLDEDTPLNRILRATCARLLRQTQHPGNASTLQRCLEQLDAATHIPLQKHHFQQVTLSRQSRRFQPLLDLCKLLFDGLSLSASGQHEAFSLCFDMNRLFEAFLEGFIQRKVLPHLPHTTLHTQGGPTTLHMLRRQDTRTPRLRLKPDLHLSHEGRVMILDAKWKRLNPDDGDHISREDIYQLTAYQRAYHAQHVALLYPFHRDFAAHHQHDYTITAPPPSGGCCPPLLRIRGVNLTDDEALCDDLVALIRAGLAI